MRIIADTHTHTIACDHAYSTILENVACAKQTGVDFLCLTEHAPAMPGGASYIFFATLGNLPRVIDGVTILKGAELNILDYKGTVDLPEEITAKLDWVIASYHTPCIDPADIASHTEGWLKIAENPHIDVIGHCGNPLYAFEHKPVLEAFYESGKIVEINAHSFQARSGSSENCRAIAIGCAELGIPVVVSSDAHLAYDIGNVEPALAMLEEIGFPKELILNINRDIFARTVENICGLALL